MQLHNTLKDEARQRLQQAVQVYDMRRQTEGYLLRKLLGSMRYQKPRCITESITAATRYTYSFFFQVKYHQHLGISNSSQRWRSLYLCFTIRLLILQLILLHKTLKAARLAITDYIVLNRTNTELLAANTRKKTTSSTYRHSIQ